MAREIESVHQFEHQSHKFGLPKEKVVMRCDDGAVYEFEQAEGRSQHRLVRRFQPDGTLSTSRGVLPAAVKETANTIINGWTK